MLGGGVHGIYILDHMEAAWAGTGKGVGGCLS